MEIALVGLLGVVLGSVISILHKLLDDHRAKKKRAEYLAIRVVYIIEKFMEECFLVAGDDGEMYGRDKDGCIQLQTKLPELGFESLDVDWQSLPFDIMYEILNFPSDVRASNGLIDSVYEYVASPPDYGEWVEERQFQYSKLGLKANDISIKLREKYCMPIKLFENWDPVEHLKHVNSKILGIRQEREVRNHELQKSA